MTRHFSVRNFDKFQHYRDRSPPWIKLYTSLLDDYEFCCLQDNERWHLIGIWILASRLNNRVPLEPKWIERMIGANTPVNLDLLLEQGWITFELQEDKEAWASRYVSTAVRARLLKAANGRCTSCGSKKNLEIDHILPISKGGTSEENNLQVLCRSCNRKKRSSSKVSADTERDLDFSLASRAPAHWRETEAETETDKRTKSHSRLSDENRVNGITERAKKIVEFGNEITGKRFRAQNPDKSLTKGGRLIVSRLKQGYSDEALTQVWATQWQAWKDNPEMREYARPETLFGPKFDSYLGTVE